MELKDKLVKQNQLESFDKARVAKPMVPPLVGLYPLVKDNH